MINIIKKNQIITMHRDGISNRKIALKLGISKDTVNSYVKQYKIIKEKISNEIDKHKIAALKPVWNLVY